MLQSKHAIEDNFAGISVSAFVIIAYVVGQAILAPAGASRTVQIVVGVLIAFGCPLVWARAGYVPDRRKARSVVNTRKPVEE